MVKDKELLIIRIIEAIMLLCVTYIFVFHMLKTAGIINTPLWIQLSPHIAGITASATAIIAIVQFYIRIKDIPYSHEKLSKRVNNMALGLARVEKDVDHIHLDSCKTDKRLERIETKIDNLSRCKNYKAAA